MKISIVILMITYSVMGWAQIIDGVMLPTESERQVYQQEPECQIQNIQDEIIVCENEAAEFEVIGNDFDELTWFALENRQKPLGYGNRFNTGEVGENATYYVQATCPYRSEQLHSIETIWRGENGKAGIMLSLYVKDTICLQSIDVHMASGFANCHIYIIQGDYLQYANNPNAWTSIYNGTVDGNGKLNPVTIDIEDIILQPQVYGVYISLENDNLLFYSNGTTVFQDEYLLIKNGTGVSWPFSSLCGCRTFNGRFHYAVGEKPKSIKYKMNANVIKKPTAPHVFCVGSQLSVNQNGSFVWYHNGTIIQNENQSVLSPSASGLYSVAKQIDQCIGSESSALFYAEPDYDDYSNQPEFYPNPVQNMLNVNTENYTSGKIQISDANGKLLYQEDFIDQQFLNIDFSNYLPGQYAISLISENDRYSQIILKH